MMAYFRFQSPPAADQPEKFSSNWYRLSCPDLPICLFPTQHHTVESP